MRDYTLGFDAEDLDEIEVPWYEDIAKILREMTDELREENDRYEKS